MIIETFIVGMLSTNCFIVNSEKSKEAIVVDPGLDSPAEAQQIFDYIAKEKLKVKLILNTHGHHDHISGDLIFQEKYGIPIYIHRYDVPLLEAFQTNKLYAPVLLEDGNLVKFGDESLKVMLTPGHTPGSICLVGEKVVFTGDTLFNEGIGRTDFPGGSLRAMRASLQKLVGLPDYLLVYPGHGPMSIIGEEKRNNPFLVDNGF